MEPAPRDDRLILPEDLPRSDLSIDLKRYGDFLLVTMAGRLNEDFDGEALGRRLIGDVLMDTRQIDRVSSFGVRAWLKMLQTADIDRLYLARASGAIVHQITMMRSFAGSGQLTSFFAPYACEGCGNSFQVEFDALLDKAIIADKAPPAMPCPHCGTSSVLDDDPDTFFSLPCLLEEQPEDLQAALDRLTPLGAAADPIEKSMRPDMTLIRVNARMDDSIRFKRVFDGLEGPVVFDLASVPGTDDVGLDRFETALNHLDVEVTSIDILGCPEALAVRLHRHPPEANLRLKSVFVTAKCDSPKRDRKVLVDLEEHAERLLAGRPPVIRCDWCSDFPSYADHQDLLTDLAKRIAPTAPEPEPSHTMRWAFGCILFVVLLAIPTFTVILLALAMMLAT